jgi:pectate disaccharide-lyase
MKKIACFSLGLLLTNLLFSSTYFVATTGADTNNGATIETPFASIVTAISKVGAGDTILVRGGIYEHSSTIYITKSGTLNDTIFLLAFSGEKPVLDFSGTTFGKRGMTLSGSYWKIGV